MQAPASGVCTSSIFCVARPVYSLGVRVSSMARGIPARSARMAVVNPTSPAKPTTASAWPWPNFHNGDPPGGQASRQSRQNTPIGIEPVGSPIQRRRRLEPRYLRHQGVQLAGGNIGRIAQDQVEAAGECRGPIGAHEGGPVGHPMHSSVVPSEGGRGGRSVGANAERVREFAKRGQQQTAGAGAEIEDPPHPRAVGQRRQRRLDQCLGIGAGDQCRGGNRQVETPELLPPGDECQRLVRHATLQQVSVGPRSIGVCRSRNKRLASDPERMCQQQTRLKARIVDAAHAQKRGAVAATPRGIVGVQRHTCVSRRTRRGRLPPSP